MWTRPGEPAAQRRPTARTSAARAARLGSGRSARMSAYALDGPVDRDLHRLAAAAPGAHRVPQVRILGHEPTRLGDLGRTVPPGRAQRRGQRRRGRRRRRRTRPRRRRTDRPTDPDRWGGRSPGAADRARCPARPADRGRPARRVGHPAVRPGRRPPRPARGTPGRSRWRPDPGGRRCAGRGRTPGPCAPAWAWWPACPPRRRPPRRPPRGEVAPLVDVLAVARRPPGRRRPPWSCRRARPRRAAAARPGRPAGGAASGARRPWARSRALPIARNARAVERTGGAAHLEISVVPVLVTSTSPTRRRLVAVQRRHHRGEAAVHVDAVVGVADRGVQLGEVVGLVGDGAGDRRRSRHGRAGCPRVPPCPGPGQLPSAGAGVLHRRVPQPQDLVVGPAHRDRHAGHVEAGHVVADQVAGDPARRRPSSNGGHLAEEHVQLDQRGAAQAVDDDDRPVAGAQRLVAPRIASTASGHDLRRLASFSRRRPGSPWMPTPTSISSSGRSKPGLPAAGVVHAVSATANDADRSLTRRPTAATAARSAPLVGQGAGDLLDDQRRAGAPPARRPRRVLHRHVVVDQHGLHRDALVGGELGGHLEVHHVAGVVLDDVQHAGAAVDGLRGGEHLVGHGRGEDLARAGGVEHARADEAAVQRLVAGAAAGDQAHLAADRGRRRGRRSGLAKSTRRSGWAAATPARASRTTASGALMNFFTTGLLRRGGLGGPVLGCCAAAPCGGR